MGENRCICCNAIIPEGEWVCINCQKRAENNKETKLEKRDRILWDIVFPMTFVLILIAVVLWGEFGQ